MRQRRDGDDVVAIDELRHGIAQRPARCPRGPLGSAQPRRVVAYLVPRRDRAVVDEVDIVRRDRPSASRSRAFQAAAWREFRRSETAGIAGAATAGRSVAVAGDSMPANADARRAPASFSFCLYSSSARCASPSASPSRPAARSTAASAMRASAWSVSASVCAASSRAATCELLGAVVLAATSEHLGPDAAPGDRRLQVLAAAPSSLDRVSSAASSSRP